MGDLGQQAKVTDQALWQRLLAVLLRLSVLSIEFEDGYYVKALCSVAAACAADKRLLELQMDGDLWISEQQAATISNEWLHVVRMSPPRTDDRLCICRTVPLCTNRIHTKGTRFPKCYDLRHSVVSSFLLWDFE